MEFITKTAMLHRRVCSGCAGASADGDLIVPDIKPDILKILQVDGRVILTDEDISDGRLSVEGKVLFKVLYIPDRENEKINCLEKSIDFSCNIDRPEITSQMIYGLCADIDRIDFHAVNSRKLRIKASVSIGYDIKLPKEFAIPVEIEDAPQMQLQKKSVSLYHISENSKRDFMLKESMEIPSGQTSIENLLRTDVAIKDKEQKIISGRIVTKGICNLCVLYTDPAGEIKFTEADIPFTEIFECDDIEENARCEIDYTVGEVHTGISADSDGDMRIIDLEISVQAAITASELLETEMICDCYMPGCETLLSVEEPELDNVCAFGSGQLTLRDQASPSKNGPAMKGIYSVVTKTNVRSTNVMRDKTAVEGSVTCYILYLSESDDSPVYSCAKEIPFSHTIETPGSMPDMACEIKAEATHTGYSLNSAGDAEIRCILSLGVRVLKKEQLRLIEAVDTTPCDPSRRKGIIIYFVQPGEGLWDIAKHFRVNADTVLSLNDLEGSEIKPGVRLIGPSC